MSVLSAGAYICSPSCAEHVEWLGKAFGATIEGEVSKSKETPPRIMHVMVKIGATVVHFCDNMSFDDKPVDPQNAVPRAFHMYLDVDDTDKVVAKAVAAGAEIAIPVSDTFWGMRYGHVKDPFGFTWAVGHMLAK